MSTITTSSGQQVETFEIEDAQNGDASTMAHDSVATELITSLGLKGQQSILNPETHTRLPYRPMEASEALVYSVLCDARCKVEDYSAEVIPLRVLQVIAHARETGLFARLEVWYPQVHKVDDPVLVGIKQEHPWPDHPSLTRDVTYLLARWGKCLLPLEQMEAMAVKVCRDRRLRKLTQMAAEVQTALTVTRETNELRYLSATPECHGLSAS